MIDASIDPYTYPLEAWWFLRPRSIHGLTHTRRVLIHAVALAEPAGLDAVEFEALVHAVSWHDISRTHDGWDPLHGRRSVARIEKLALAHDLYPEVEIPLLFAVEWHSTDDDLAVQAAAEIPGVESRLRVLWVLKDADGLDRVRINDLDVTSLRSDAARAREDEAWRLYKEMP